MRQQCNRATLARKIREARKMPVPNDLKPLRRHLLRLAADSAKRGYCQRAGREVAYARKLSKKYA